MPLFKITGQGLSAIAVLVALLAKRGRWPESRRSGHVKAK
jgi:hypothetical protein